MTLSLYGLRARHRAEFGASPGWEGLFGPDDLALAAVPCAPALAANCTHRGARPPRKGEPLCQGIISCGACGCRIGTRYQGKNHRAYYDCMGHPHPVLPLNRRRHRGRCGHPPAADLPDQRADHSCPGRGRGSHPAAYPRAPRCPARRRTCQLRARPRRARLPPDRTGQPPGRPHAGKPLRVETGRPRRGRGGAGRYPVRPARPCPAAPNSSNSPPTCPASGTTRPPIPATARRALRAPSTSTADICPM